MTSIQRFRSPASSVGIICLLGYIGTIFAANWAVDHYGVVPVGFGLMAPAAVYFVGVAFTLRDFVQEALGRWFVVGAIIVGALLSALVSPKFAMASGIAFLVSESADLAVYTPLRERNWLGAVVASNVVGILIDSWIFLWLAFHSLAFFRGQVVGKLWMTVAAVVILTAVRRRRVVEVPA